MRLIPYSISYEIIIGRDMISQKNCVNFSAQSLLICSRQFYSHESSIINFRTVNTDLDFINKTNLIKILTKYQQHFVKGVPTSRVRTGQLQIPFKDNNKIVQRRLYHLSPTELDLLSTKYKISSNAI